MEDNDELLLSDSLQVHEPFECSSACTGPSECHGHGQDPTALSLQSGMLMHTKEGLVCLSLKNSLSTDLSGLVNLSVEDLHHASEQLPQQNVISFGSPSCQIPMTSLETNNDSTQVDIPSTDDCTKSTYECILDNNVLSKAEEYIAVSNPLEPLELELATTVPPLESAETFQPALPKAVQVPVSIAKANSAPDCSQKKRGGWPKGRKRKPEAAVRPPKAPATAYVLFLNEKRKLYKDIPFPDVTKLLGNEWSRMSLDEKKAYLEQAEVEKKRYKYELSLYRKSDAYRIFMTEQRLKSIQNNATEESDMDATDEIDDEDNEELYCRSCDQWFNTLHNKKEHLYGRQHLQSISNMFAKRKPNKNNIMDSGNGSSCSLDESSVDGISNFTFQSAGYGKFQSNKIYDLDCPPNVNDALLNFMQIVIDREKEASVLQQKVSFLQEEREKLEREIVELRKREVKTKTVQDSEQVRASDLENQLFNLLAVPALFVEGSDAPEDDVHSSPESNTNTIICDMSSPFTPEIPSSVVFVQTDDVMSSMDSGSDSVNFS